MVMVPRHRYATSPSTSPLTNDRRTQALSPGQVARCPGGTSPKVSDLLVGNVCDQSREGDPHPDGP